MPLTVLVVRSETPDQQEARRQRSGQASHETYADTLRDLAPDLRVEHASCVDGSDVPDLSRFDGLAFPGSPIQMHDDTPETRSAARFMEDALRGGAWAFGSCAGLQIAAVAAGGAVSARDGPMNVAITHGITRTAAGADHPLLAGRPVAWDAPTMHSSQIDRLPEGGTVLAHSPDVPVEAAEIRLGAGTFRGVQYHPELTLWEIARTLEGQAGDLVAQDLAVAEDDVRRHAARLDALHADPARLDLRWQLGIGAEVAEPDRRRREIANALAWLRG